MAKIKKKINYKKGDVLLVETFAGPEIYQKVIEKVNTTSEWSTFDSITVKGFSGVFTRRKDLLALKKRSVPYTGKEKLSKTESFTYDFQILKVIKKS